MSIPSNFYPEIDISSLQTGNSSSSSSSQNSTVNRFTHIEGSTPASNYVRLNQKEHDQRLQIWHLFFMASSHYYLGNQEIALKNFAEICKLKDRDRFTHFRIINHPLSVHFKNLQEIRDREFEDVVSNVDPVELMHAYFPYAFVRGIENIALVFFHRCIFAFEILMKREHDILFWVLRFQDEFHGLKNYAKFFSTGPDLCNLISFFEQILIRERPAYQQTLDCLIKEGETTDRGRVFKLITGCLGSQITSSIIRSIPPPRTSSSQPQTPLAPARPPHVLSPDASNPFKIPNVPNQSKQPETEEIKSAFKLVEGGASRISPSQIGTRGQARSYEGEKNLSSAGANLQNRQVIEIESGENSPDFLQGEDLLNFGNLSDLLKFQSSKALGGLRANPILLSPLRGAVSPLGSQHSTSSSPSKSRSPEALDNLDGNIFSPNPSRSEQSPFAPSTSSSLPTTQSPQPFSDLAQNVFSSNTSGSLQNPFAFSTSWSSSKTQSSKPFSDLGPNLFSSNTLGSVQNPFASSTSLSSSTTQLPKAFSDLGPNLISSNPLGSIQNPFAPSTSSSSSTTQLPKAFSDLGPNLFLSNTLGSVQNPFASSTSSSSSITQSPSAFSDLGPNLFSSNTLGSVQNPFTPSTSSSSSTTQPPKAFSGLDANQFPLNSLRSTREDSLGSQIYGGSAAPLNFLLQANQGGLNTNPVLLMNLLSNIPKNVHEALSIANQNAKKNQTTQVQSNVGYNASLPFNLLPGAQRSFVESLNSATSTSSISSVVQAQTATNRSLNGLPSSGPSFSDQPAEASPPENRSHASSSPQSAPHSLKDASSQASKKRKVAPSSS